MNKRCSILTCVSSILIFMFFSIAILGTGGGRDSLQAEYEAMNKNFEEKMKTIRTRDAYRKLVDEYKKGLQDILKKLEKVTPTDESELLKGRLLFDLNRSDEAAKIFERLVREKSPLANPAKFEIVKLLLKKNSYDEALSLFRQVENIVEKDKNYYWVLFQFAFSAKENKDREEYSYKFVRAVGNAKEFENFKAMAYGNLARLEKEKGNIKKGIEILEKALGELTSKRATAELKALLEQMKMLGAPAPEIDAETWVNSSALKLSDLKGKAVVIDFWATWCRPCHIVIPVLTKNYNQYKDKGLVVIGFTRLYSNYSDDQGGKGRVSPGEERKLIAGFVKRHKITYPIAIADKGVIFDTYNITGLPTMVLIDKEGNVQDVEVGGGDEEYLEKKIKSLLE
ncbi:MAG: redoxin domain-containing protein [Candidatus Aminicenantes bacterium]|nr:MAG: redoxin domain-containing protein [Candidatus Aminicenantes bacterium]